MKSNRELNCTYLAPFFDVPESILIGVRCQPDSVVWRFNQAICSSILLRSNKWTLRGRRLRRQRDTNRRTSGPAAAARSHRAETGRKLPAQKQLPCRCTGPAHARADMLIGGRRLQPHSPTARAAAAGHCVRGNPHKSVYQDSESVDSSTSKMFRSRLSRLNHINQDTPGGDAKSVISKAA